MGATTFAQVAPGATLEAAFTAAVAQARHAYGHSGYTGSIAEKPCAILATGTPMTLDAARMLVDDELLDDERFEDKWGPAGAIPLTTGGFLLFGWASE